MRFRCLDPMAMATWSRESPNRSSRAGLASTQTSRSRTPEICTRDTLGMSRMSSFRSSAIAFIWCSGTSPVMTTLTRGAKSWVLNWLTSGSSAASGSRTLLTAARTSWSRSWNLSSGMVSNLSQTNAPPSREIEVMAFRSSTFWSSSSRGTVIVFSISSGETP